MDGDTESIAAGAITYFYEPFLEAYDPELRKSLGVWYTPPEIVRYQVLKVDRMLREEFGIELGLADDRVVVLDPCCGTGAYLVETLKTIAATLREEGVGIEMGARLRHALTQRVIGFEILTAPFVIAHLQLYLLLSAMDAAPGDGERLAVFLTNALTGWESGGEQLKLNFPELQRERDAARQVKQKAEVIVVIGNPPYNRFAGAAQKAEGDLVDHYKGIKRNAKGKQIGKSELFTKWGIRKHLLDDLYVRFFRLAEQRIGDRAKFGLVSFISNNRYLSGKSFPIMRDSLVHSFQDIWIDNLHGYRQASERTPWDTTCETIFAMATSSGIKVGTAVVTYVKRPGGSTQPASLHVRNFHGRALAKRQALLLSLQTDDPAAICLEGDDRVSIDCHIPTYEPFETDASKRWKMVPYDASGGYDDWASLDELFPERYQGVNPNRGIDGSLVDVDAAALAHRMRDYYSPLPWLELADRYPELTKDREVGADKKAKFISRVVRERLLKTSGFDEKMILPYHNFPLDARFIYYEQKEKLINRHRPELWENLADNEFFVLQPEPRRVTAGRPVLVNDLFDLHLHEGGSVGIPSFTTPSLEPGTLFSAPAKAGPSANLAPQAWEALRDAYQLTGELTGGDARTLVRSLFRAALALAHAPKFESDHRESLAQDWMHFPIPKDAALLTELAEAGDLIAALLNPLQTARPALRALLGNAYTKLAVVSRTATATGPVDTSVTYAYFGSGKGRWEVQLPTPEWLLSGEGSTNPVEDHPWGDVAGDFYLNATTFLANVPERVWRYELGGYPVVKKWLGYRQAKRRDGKPLTSPELDHLRGIVHRVAALLVLHSRLDELYECAIDNPFTVEDLGLNIVPS